MQNAMLMVTVDSRCVKAETYERVKVMRDYRELINRTLSFIPEGATYYKHTPVSNPLHTVFRIKYEDLSESFITITVLDSTPIDSQKWVFEDRKISNAQGGVTHLRGWMLE